MDAAYVMYSPYKSRPTGKVLNSTSPGSAICNVSGVQGGRLSDAVVVREFWSSGQLEEAGVAGGEFNVTADRGFNSKAPLSMQDERYFVAPPWKR